MTDKVDVAVLGAGPAGLEAAITAVEMGLRVALVDHYPQAGGQYYKQLPAAFQGAIKTAAQRDGKFLLGLLDGLPVKQYLNTLVWGAFPAEGEAGWLLALHGEGAPKRLQARAVIIATGAYDLAVPFPGWTLPGVITGGATQILVKNQGVVPGKRALLSGSGPLQLAVAAQLIRAGVEVTAVLEASSPIWKGMRHAFDLWGQWERMIEGWDYARAMIGAGVPYRLGWSVVAAHGTESVQETVIARLDGNWKPIPGSEQRIAVDTVITSFGLVPNNGIARMLGCAHTLLPEKGGFVPTRDETMQTTQPDVYVVGDAAGIGGAELARLEGRVAGLAAAWRSGKLNDSQVSAAYGRFRHELKRQQRFAKLLGILFTPQPGIFTVADAETIVCRCEEITLGEIHAAVADGARTPGEVKMLTRCGMGNCQGRMCELNVARAIVNAAAEKGTSLQGMDGFTVRPPLHPLTVSALAEAAELDDV